MCWVRTWLNVYSYSCFHRRGITSANADRHLPLGCCSPSSEALETPTAGSENHPPWAEGWTECYFNSLKHRELFGVQKNCPESQIKQGSSHIPFQVPGHGFSATRKSATSWTHRSFSFLPPSPEAGFSVWWALQIGAPQLLSNWHLQLLLDCIVKPMANAPAANFLAAHSAYTDRSCLLQLEK